MGGGSYESCGGNNDGACTDPTECTEITFTENIDYEGSYYEGVEGGGDTHHHVHTHHVRNSISTPSSSNEVIITIVIISFLFMFGKIKFSLLQNS